MTLKVGQAAILVLVAMVTDGTVIDLTHTLGPDSYVHAAIPSYNHTSIYYGNITGTSIFVNHGFLVVPEHAGTHIDTPSHFVKDGITLDNLDITELVAEGVMLDFKSQAQANRNYLVTVEDLENWETEHGRIPNKAAVLFNFGWTEKFTDIDDFVGNTQHTDFGQFHFPAVSNDAGQWLIDERDIHIIAVDTLSPDPAQTERIPFSIHVTYLPHGRLILENVKMPDSLPDRNFRLYAMPYRFTKSTGAPTRVFAVTHEDLGSGTSGLASGVMAVITWSIVGLLFCK